MQQHITLAGAIMAARFFKELLETFDTFTSLADEYGSRTLADLLYLQGALLHGGFIDAWPDSHVLSVVDALPSAKDWRQHISIFEHDECVHECKASTSDPVGVPLQVAVLTSDTLDGRSVSAHASREAALQGLRQMLSEYGTYGAAGPGPCFTPAEIDEMVDECDRAGSITVPHGDEYTIEMVPIQLDGPARSQDQGEDLSAPGEQDETLARTIALGVARACAGQPGVAIERLGRAGYFTALFQGDEILLANADGSPASDLFGEVEAIAGAPLVHRTDLGSPHSEVMGFPAREVPKVLERLS